MKITEILTQPESKSLEFKRDLSSLKPILKTLAVFANSAGGFSIQSTYGGIRAVFGGHNTYYLHPALHSCVAMRQLNGNLQNRWTINPAHTTFLITRWLTT